MLLAGFCFWLWLTKNKVFCWCCCHCKLHASIFFSKIEHVSYVCFVSCQWASPGHFPCWIGEVMLGQKSPSFVVVVICILYYHCSVPLFLPAPSKSFFIETFEKGKFSLKRILFVVVYVRVHIMYASLFFLLNLPQRQWRWRQHSAVSLFSPRSAFFYNIASPISAVIINMTTCIVYESYNFEHVYKVYPKILFEKQQEQPSRVQMHCQI